MGRVYHTLSLSALFTVFLPVLVNATYVVRGNTIQSRQGYINQGARKSWVDLNPDNILPDGTLSQIHVFIHDVPPSVLTTGTRLQIWRPMSSNKYKLVWEKRVTFTDGGNRRYVFEVEDEGVAVKAGDRIGWTYEADAGPISYTSVQHRKKKTAFYSYTNLPTVGSVHTFSFVQHPSVFSIAVVIYEKKCIPTYIGLKPLKQVSDDKYDKDKMTYLDRSLELQNGTLKSLMFYAQDLPIGNDTDTIDISFHVFRPLKEDRSYRVIWNYNYTLEDGVGRSYEITLDNTTEVDVMEGDFIGWTYLQDFTFISYEFSGGGFTFKESFGEITVGQTYKYTTFGRPYKHMVAATIETQCEEEKDADHVTPVYIVPTTKVTTSTTQTSTLTEETTESPVTTALQPVRKPLPSWFPYVIIGVAIFIVVIIIVFVLLYLRDRNYRRTRYDVYDVKFHKRKGHSRGYDHPSAEIMFPSSVGLYGYKPDLNHYMDFQDYGYSNYENFTVQLGSDGDRQVYDNPGFTAEAIVHHGDDTPVTKNNNTLANGRTDHAYSEEIEQIQHI